MFPHLMAEEVAAFVEGRIGRSRSRWLTLHLIGCPQCSEVFQRLHPRKGNQRLAVVLGMAAPPPSWPTDIARCALEIAEKDLGPALWKALKHLPSPERCLRLRNLPRSQVTPALIMALLHDSKGLWHESATEAAKLAALALELVLKLLASDYPWTSLLADLAAEGLGYLGNAERIQGDLRSAEPKLTSALLLALVPGSRDARLVGLLLRLWGKVCHDAEDYSVADALYRLAESCFEGVEDDESLATLELERARLLADQGELGPCTERLEKLIHSQGFSKLSFLLQLSATQSLADRLCELGRFFEARKLLPEVERLVRIVGGELNHLKVQWLRARVAVGTRRLRAAEILYREVRDRWIKLEHSMDAALVTLELAELYLAWGRPHEAREQALVVLEVCRSLEGMRREELEAVATLARAEEGLLEPALASLRSLLETSRCPAQKRVQT